MDFNTNYAVVKDDLVIYAPQTEDVHDLLTDAMNSIWYTEDGYYDLKSIYENAKTEMNYALKTFEDSAKNVMTDEQFEERERAESEYFKKRDAYYTAQRELEKVLAYIPNGINNAFVDIDYTLTDPDGDMIATMHIPHGKAYHVDENTGEPTIEWDIVKDGVSLDEKGRRIITKSGSYTISTSITPVNTNVSPGWHVSTVLDPSDRWSVYPYDSESFSPTGSTATGTGEAITVTEHPTAYLFKLKLIAEDSRRQHQYAIDFTEGSEQLRDMVERKTNKHITGYEWICTDGETKSRKENEPGIMGHLKIGSDVMITSQICDQAYDEGLVENIENTTTIMAEDGAYVPVNVLVSRTIGSLNKSDDPAEQITQRNLVMSDSDNVFGPGMSSVEWVHDCDIITAWDCNDDGKEFEESHKYDEPESIGELGKVRYLMHVYNNPVPDINKTTSTPMITKGMNIDWQVRIDNNNEKTNKFKRYSEFSMIDILPYSNDGRIDPNYGTFRPDGSKFSGILYYKMVSVDFENAVFAQRHATMYYTNDTGCRDASDQQLTGAISGINWIQAEASADGTTIAYTIPETAVAIRLDTWLDWEEVMLINMQANVNDLAVQKVGDYYHNQALILQDEGQRTSNTVSTEVANVFISGTVWEDLDTNGLMLNGEPTVDGIRVTLYAEQNALNKNNPVIRTINGINLIDAYDIEFNKFAPQLTSADGTFSFDQVPNGTYYIVADLIPKDHVITKQHVGSGNEADEKIDSEAEVTMISSGSSLEKTAWIKKVVVNGKSVPGQNFGLQKVTGNIKVGKIINEIYYPTTMTDEEKEDYRVNATFILTNRATGSQYKKTVYLHEPDITLKGGEAQIWAEFNDLPLGIYDLAEEFDVQYHLSDIVCTKGIGNVTINKATGIASINITADKRDFTLRMENTARPDPPAGDENGIMNRIKIRTPIKLDITYVGADPLTNTQIATYTWQYSDFDPRKGGDIVVTYDDDTQISLSAGTLNFSDITFNPGTVTNMMNSENRKTTITGYYTERGHTVRDSFKVLVNLKPLHRFRIRFFSNGSTFDNSTTMNVVYFVYDEINKCNVVTSGIYKDEANKGLNNLKYFWQAGWNTRNDGQGKQYGAVNDTTGKLTDANALDPLNAIGMDTGIDSIDLYANWKTNVTFHANGGTLAGGSASWETAARGRSSVIRPFSKNQSISTSLSGAKAIHRFAVWNTASNVPYGRGEELPNYNSNHGGCQGPVTFYAIYYQSDYQYTGGQQMFVAPVDGWYKVQLWGAAGGWDNGVGGPNYPGGPAGEGLPGGNGGYVTGEIKLMAGQSVYVYVGRGGLSNMSGSGAGYNGGGNPGTLGWSGSGGGATDIRLVGGRWDNPAGLSSRILVAAGGGGAGHSRGGYGGGAAGGISEAANSYQGHQPGVAGGTQSSAGPRGGFGYGGTNAVDGGGGGGGWYGGGAGNKDVGGGGGSSYIGGQPSAPVRNADSIAGNRWMPSYNGGSMLGNAGPCYGTFLLVDRNVN